MGDLLSELGKKLAERWLSLLILPGALYLAVAAAGHTLGHGHAFDLHRLTRQVTAWADAPAARTVGGQVVLLAAVLAGAAAAGVAAQALGSLVERLWLAADWAAWPAPLRRAASWRTTSRRGRWTDAARALHRRRELAARARGLGQRADHAALDAAHHAMHRVAAECPERPTWSGDRLNAVAVRLERDHNLDLAVLWPHLWLVLPEESRAQVTAARQALSRATALAAWAVLYLPLAYWWWPAALITSALALTSRGRTRAAADTYALLLEAATLLHTRALLERLGLDSGGPLTRETGDALSLLLSPSTPPPPPPVDAG